MSARAWYIIGTLILSLLAAYWGGMLLKGSDAARDGLINLFAILAGVLVAVISIIGDPSMLLPGNWRVGSEHADEMQKRIARFSHLFLIYIISLVLLVLGAVVKDAQLVKLDAVFPALTFFCAWGALLSIPLPYCLMAIQKERMKEEIKNRKKKGSDNNPGAQY